MVNIAFCVVPGNKHNILGNPAMQALQMTYNAKSQQVFHANNQADMVTALTDVVIKPHQIQVVKGQFHGQVKSFTNYLATIKISHLLGIWWAGVDQHGLQPVLNVLNGLQL